MRDSQETCGESPNDPKLSDRAARRDACPTAARTETKPSRKQREAKKARGVTRGPVRCSAWLGDVDSGFPDAVSVSISDMDSSPMTPQEHLETTILLARSEYPNLRLGLFLVCGPWVALPDSIRSGRNNRK